ncbi:MAG: MASE3 domain-containing protein [Actinomycetota bacterium]
MVTPASYLTFHTIVEFYSIVVSFLIFAVSWHAYSRTKRTRSLLLGTAFLAIGLIDLFHMLSYKGMPVFFTPSDVSKGIYFWLIARLIASGAFLASAFIPSSSDSRLLRRSFLLGGSLLISLVTLIVVIYFSKYLPAVYVEGVGVTTTKFGIEYFVIALTLGAGLAYWRMFKKTHDRFIPFLLGAFAASVLSGVAFTLYTNPYDIFNILGHILKTVAYMLIYWAIFVSSVSEPYSQLFKAQEELKRSHANLEKLVEGRTWDLREANIRLAEISQAKSEFLASMSHELRTPLNSIIGFADLLLEGVPKKLDAAQREYIGYISESSKHLLNLINDVLDLSKVEAGKMEVELSEFSLDDLVRSSLIMVSERAKKHGIDLSVDLGRSDHIVRADVRKLKQIMVNLLSNAVKFTPDGGRVGVEAKRDSDGGLEITVWDTGIGIAPKDQEKIFDEFQQVRKHGPEGDGTGLGLMLTRKMVELHRGKIQVESQPGKGSRFTFTLPQ